MDPRERSTSEAGRTDLNAEDALQAGWRSGRARRAVDWEWQGGGRLEEVRTRGMCDCRHVTQGQGQVLALSRRLGGVAKRSMNCGF